MFTGIIEATGLVRELRREGGNLHLCIEAPFASELKVDQSVAHNGVCLTVTEKFNDYYSVTAVEETLKRTNLSHLVAGHRVNLERCLRLGDRLDGHMVQGHVDGVALCTAIAEQNGSWNLWFEYDRSIEHFTVTKGSICVNGVSLTVVHSEANRFSVVVIPYTWQHTNLSDLTVGSKVNLEFDILGKYIERLWAARNA